MKSSTGDFIAGDFIAGDFIAGILLLDGSL
jgi:hypothetical protein